jgi:hypothetical protein
MLLPPSITKAKSTTDLVGPNDVHRDDRVYITTNINAALMYASVFRRGVIYEVEPIGKIEPDPDCSMVDLSFQCERARIKRIQKISDLVLSSARDLLITIPK